MLYSKQGFKRAVLLSPLLFKRCSICNALRSANKICQSPESRRANLVALSERELMYKDCLACGAVSIAVHEAIVLNAIAG